MADNENTNPMYIDTSAINFFDLDDIKGIGLEGGKVREDLMGRDVDNTNYDENDEMFGLHEIEDEVPNEYEDDDEVGDLRGKPEVDEDGNYTNPSEYFSTLEDDAEIDFGGVTLTKADMKHMASNREAITENEQFLKAHSERWSETNDYIRGVLQRNATETQLTISALQERLNDPRATATERGQFFSDLKRQEAKMSKIEADFGEAEQARKAQDAQRLNYRIRETDLSMKKALGNDWNMQDAIQYATTQGMAIPELEASVSPGLAQILAKAMKYDKIETARNAKLKETITRGARSKPSNSPVQRDEGASKSIARKRMLDKLHKGQANERDVSNSFAFLED